MKAFWAVLFLACTAASPAAMAQTAPPAAAPAGTPIKDLLNDGFQVASTSGNGNASEVVLILNKEKKHFACVLSGLRADTYAQPARPVFPACVPLN